MVQDVKDNKSKGRQKNAQVLLKQEQDVSEGKNLIRQNRTLSTMVQGAPWGRVSYLANALY